MKKDIKRWYNVAERCSIYGLLLLMDLFILSRSPMNPAVKSATSTDSSVFKYIALVMSKGGMPYRDAFDHKGPLLYIINYLGQQISYYRGVWVIEFISMFIYFVIIYRISRMFCKRWVALGVVALTAAPFDYLFQQGNFTEEYALPFIAGGMYIFLDFFLKHKISKARLVMCGFCFGCVAMLRVNMVSMWVVFCLAALIYDFKKKENKWLTYIAYFVIGMMCAIIPFIIWLLANGALADFWRDYILFNLKYVGDKSRAHFANKVDSFLQFVGDNIVITSIPVCGYLIYTKKYKSFDIVYLISILFTGISISVSGMKYWHYGMILLPMLVYPFSRIFETDQKHMEKGMRLVLTIYMLTLALPSWKTMTSDALQKLHAGLNTQEDKTSFENVTTEIVLKNTTEDEPIMVLGNSDFFYIATQRVAASRYSYQVPIAYVDPIVLKNVQEDMINNCPYIVIDVARDEALFPNKDEYELLVVEDEWDVYRLKGEKRVVVAE